MTVEAIDVSAAATRIAALAQKTPVVPAPALSALVDGAPVWLKLENLQATGSFKVRGAANKIASLNEAERARGIVTCSSGNHGRAVAFVAEALGVAATVCVPEWVDPVKLQAIRQHGAEVVLHGATYDEAEARSLEIQTERELTYVHPFDDPYVIAGQGTIGLELMEQIPGLGTVVVPLSGGGLIAGVATAVREGCPDCRVVGVSAENACVMYRSLEAGAPQVIPEEETIASALAGGIGVDNRYSFDLVRELVDENVLVTEAEIREAMRFAASEYRIVVEGGGAVAIAALLYGKVTSGGGALALVVSGGNVDPTVLAEVLSESG
jgi:threonine dehydratase